LSYGENAQGSVYQALAPMATGGGKTAVVGSWPVECEAALGFAFVV
jgi:glutathionylspermidine synthase